jgi:hypothetical protein
MFAVEPAQPLEGGAGSLYRDDLDLPNHADSSDYWRVIFVFYLMDISY